MSQWLSAYLSGAGQGHVLRDFKSARFCQLMLATLTLHCPIILEVTMKEKEVWTEKVIFITRVSGFIAEKLDQLTVLEIPQDPAEYSMEYSGTFTCELKYLYNRAHFRNSCTKIRMIREDQHGPCARVTRKIPSKWISHVMKYKLSPLTSISESFFQYFPLFPKIRHLILLVSVPGKERKKKKGWIFNSSGITMTTLSGSYVASCFPFNQK